MTPPVILDEWTFVTAAYVVAIGGTVATTLWAYLAMRRAERNGPKDSGPKDSGR